MNKSLLVLFFGFHFAVFAQSPLKQYTIVTKFSDSCMSYISIPLFAAEQKKDSLNQLIINELIKYHYGENNPGLIPYRFYNETKYGSDAPLNRNIVAENTLANKGIYSFIACPINACTEDLYSNYESIAFTLDSAARKALYIKDIIVPEKLDSFEGFVYWVGKRYNIKNLPTGYITSINPPQVKGSNTLIANSTVSLERGVQRQFYIREQILMVFNEAQHENYPYKSVEIAIPLNLLQYFMKPKYFILFTE
jgi:hypothetical protein